MVFKCRLRYEVNPKLIKDFEANGFAFIGRDADRGDRMEIGELVMPLEISASCRHYPATSPKRTATMGNAAGPRGSHRYFVGTQFHPEYTSRPMSPSPFFLGLVLAANSHQNQLEKYFSELTMMQAVGSGKLMPPTSGLWLAGQQAGSFSYNSLFPLGFEAGAEEDNHAVEK